MDPVRVIAWIFLAALGIPLLVIALAVACYVTLAVVAHG
jgi:hypothetical protein